VSDDDKPADQPKPKREANPTTHPEPNKPAPPPTPRRRNGARGVARLDDRLLTPPETAEFLRTTVGVLKVWRSRGDGPPFVKVGRSVRYRWSALDRWVDDQTAVAS